MKKFICLILALTVCACLACPAFATEADGSFVSSPSAPEGCEHVHGTKLVGEKSASCSAEGYTGDLVCSDCGEVIEKGTVIPKLGHKYVDGVCQICGANEKVPQTGDNSFVAGWMIIMAVAAVGLVTVTAFYRKKIANH